MVPKYFLTFTGSDRQLSHAILEHFEVKIQLKYIFPVASGCTWNFGKSGRKNMFLTDKIAQKAFCLGGLFYPISCKCLETLIALVVYLILSFTNFEISELQV